jgi:hypothetical protein
MPHSKPKGGRISIGRKVNNLEDRAKDAGLKLANMEKRITAMEESREYMAKLHEVHNAVIQLAEARQSPTEPPVVEAPAGRDWLDTTAKSAIIFACVAGGILSIIEARG